MYLRLTALGAYCLGLVPSYRPASLPAGGRLRVMPQLRVEVAAGELAPSDLLALDAYAERQPGPAWALTVPRLLAAIDEGHPLDELRAFLQARSDAPLPASVEALFTDVEARAGQVRDRGPVRLLECADEAVAALLAKDPRTRKDCRPAGGVFLVVPAAAEVAFRKGLREVGYLVLGGGAGAEAAGPSSASSSASSRRVR